MDISGEYRVAGDRQAVWRALNDPEVLRRCVPGCEQLEQIDATRYRGRVRLSIGPLSTRLHIELGMTNAEWPSRYRLEGNGQAGSIGFGRGHADVVLTEDGGSTVLRYAADLQVGGRMAQLGSRLIMGTTRKLVDDFFGSFAREMDTTPLPARAELKTGVASLSRWVALLVALALTAWLLMSIWN